jgi:hypothetical protein
MRLSLELTIHKMAVNQQQMEDRSLPKSSPPVSRNI